MKFNAVNNKEGGCMLSVSGQCGGSSAVSLACIISMCFVQRFLAASLFVLPWDHSFHSFTTISPPPFIFPLINQCVRCLVPLAWGLMVGRRGFTRGWLCQKCKHLDIPGTHLH